MDVKPKARAPRWRRRVRIALAVVATAYAALWIVRLTRGYQEVPARRFLGGAPLVIAHRGGPRGGDEHTLTAYRRALADGADVLELDVHLARGGAIVVSHDPGLSRVLGVPLAIAEHDLAALRAALATRHPGRAPRDLLPTLDEVLAEFPAVRLNVELKPDSAALADAVAALLARTASQDRVLVASFHGDALARFRAASGGRVATSASLGEATRFYLCYLVEVPCRPAFEALQLPTALRRSWPRLRLDTRAFVEFAHRHGLAVHYFTVDERYELIRLFALGADGVMTDQPARAAALRAQAAAHGIGR